MEQERMIKTRFQSGMSLIELMIALLIGLLLSAAIITVYISNKKTFWDTEAAASLQENSRFAMKLIANDLRLAGFYGGSDYKVIERDIVAGGGGDVDGDGVVDLDDAAYVDPLGSSLSCKRGTIETEYEYERSIWIATVSEADDGSDVGTGVRDGLPDCLAGKSIPAFINQVGSTVLFVKHTAPTPHDPLTDTDGNKTYIISSLDIAGHFDGVNSTALASHITAASRYPDGGIWEYMYHAYYISKPQNKVFPQLKRMSLKNNTWSVETVADGIEDIQFELGLDTTGDGAANAYVVAGSTIPWEQVVSAKIYLLAQATTSDISFDDARTYEYPGRTYNPSDKNRHKYHRKLYETTVTLFNNQMERTRGL